MALAPITVNVSYLESLFEAPSEHMEEILTYCDFVSSDRFNVELKLKEHVTLVDDDDKSRFLGYELTDVMALIRWTQRQKKFERQLKDPQFQDKPIIVSEGDSWFHHPFVKDTIDFIMEHYPVASQGGAMDELQNMVYHSQQFLDIVEQYDTVYVLLSGGGNDVLGTEQFKDFLHQVHKDDKDKPMDHYVNNRLKNRLKTLYTYYIELIDAILAVAPNVKILIHGYDYIIPGLKDKKVRLHERLWKKRYLQEPMEEKGICDGEDQKKIIRYILDKFNDNQQKLEDLYTKNGDRKVIYVNVRNTVEADEWDDEIHPKEEGFGKVAQKFLKVLQSLDSERVVMS